MVADKEDRLIIGNILEADRRQFDAGYMPDDPQRELHDALHEKLGIFGYELSDKPQDAHDRNRENKIDSEQQGHQY